MFCQISVLKKPEKFTEKHTCWSLVFNKVAGWKIVPKLTKKHLRWSLIVNNAIGWKIHKIRKKVPVPVSCFYWSCKIKAELQHQIVDRLAITKQSFFAPFSQCALTHYCKVWQLFAFKNMIVSSVSLESHDQIEYYNRRYFEKKQNSNWKKWSWTCSNFYVK